MSRMHRALCTVAGAALAIAVVGILFPPKETVLESPSSFVILFPEKGPTYFSWKGLEFHSQEPGRVTIEGHAFCFIGVSGVHRQSIAHHLIAFQKALPPHLGVGFLYAETQTFVLVFGQNAQQAPGSVATEAARPLLQIPFGTSRELDWRMHKRDPNAWMLVGLQ